jgi:hypothetical protein
MLEGNVKPFVYDMFFGDIAESYSLPRKYVFQYVLSLYPFNQCQECTIRTVATSRDR